MMCVADISDEESRIGSDMLWGGLQKKFREGARTTGPQRTGFRTAVPPKSGRPPA